MGARTVVRARAGGAFVLPGGARCAIGPDMPADADATVLLLAIVNRFVKLDRVWAR
jgi:hypothetical protein